MQKRTLGGKTASLHYHHELQPSYTLCSRNLSESNNTGRKLMAFIMLSGYLLHRLLVQRRDRNNGFTIILEFNFTLFDILRYKERFWEHIFVQAPKQDMSACRWLPKSQGALSIAFREVEGKGSTARFKVKRTRCAEGQQTGHDLSGGIGKTFDRTHTSCGRRWIALGIAARLF